ncbi:hypothetical protein [Blastococcus sp. TBT05-19]|uniref:hypothetical protein n=1 Tax=Blastococcus sp. TBT05-19 TaxID=2250581 RepID=UPI0018F637C8|nr:hypothetical protein [Blastococcus sp. TBT05-19]
MWSAGWLALLLVLGMLRFGDPAVQWPVLLVPALWALIALRPRRRSRMPVVERDRPSRRRPEPAEDEFPWDDEVADDRPYDEPTLPPGTRTDTVERPALRRRQDPYDDDRW